MKLYANSDGYYILHGYIASEDERLEGDLTFTTWQPTPKMLKLYKYNNFKHVFVSSWTTSANHEDLKELLNLAQDSVLSSIGAPINLHLFESPSCNIYSLDVQWSPGKEGHLSHKRLPIYGRQLLISIFINDDPDIEKQEQQLRQILTLLRHQMGLNFAVHQTLKNYYSIEKNTSESKINCEVIPEGYFSLVRHIRAKKVQCPP